jgi:3-oxoacyl-[acyl-carrier protein] reductase
MDLGLRDKAALVFASSAGLGKGIATELAREGAHVMLFARSEETLAATQADIQATTGNRPDFIVGDMNRREDIEGAVVKTVDKYGGLFALVNNTGGPPAGQFTDFGDDDWQLAFQQTLLSYVRSIRAALPIMEEAGGGRILNNTSSSIKNVIDNLLLSNVFRLGIQGLSKTIAREFGPKKILVNVVGAGKIATGRVDHLDRLAAEKQNLTLEEFQAHCQANVPLGRYGTIEEFGKMATFLCSPANTYITGQSILIDGGAIQAY